MFVDFLRKYKWSYVISNFFNRKKLQHNIELYKKYKLNKKYYSPISSLDFESIDQEAPIMDRVDSAQELPKQELFGKLDRKTQENLSSWSKNGYVILHSFFQEEEINLINKEVEELIQTKKIRWSKDRILFAFKKSKIIQSVATFPKLKSFINLLMGKEMELFQSINFYKSSQQKTHSDSIHMSTFPNGNIIAVWIALQDVSPTQGPLHYYPGSHKLPYIMNKDFDNKSSKYKLGNKSYSDYEDRIEQLIKENPQLKKEIFLAKKGDVLIWHANLLHGAEPNKDLNASRKSMVFHYYSKDAIAYHEITERPTLK
jgi:ectoine hydroxylase-related dioxygenase (phytanoyl-CoA dioxygenase family)